MRRVLACLLVLGIALPAAVPAQSRKAAQDLKGEIGVLVEKGDAEIEQQKFEDALATFQKLLATAPGLWISHNRMGRILSVLGRNDEALAEFEKSHRIQETPVNQMNWTYALVFKGDFANALGHAKRWADLEPKNANAHRAVGDTSAQLGLVDEAMTSWKRAATLEESAFTYYNLASFAVKKKDYDEAETFLAKGLKADPSTAGAAQELRARIAYDRGNVKGAIEEMTKAVEIAPEAQQESLKDTLIEYCLAAGDYRKAFYLAGPTPRLGVETAFAPFGIKIASIAKNGPADLAGLKAGDVIVEFEGRPLAGVTPDKFRSEMVKGTAFGGTVNLKIERGGEYFDAFVVAGITADLPELAAKARRDARPAAERPAEPTAAPPAPAPEKAPDAVPSAIEIIEATVSPLPVRAGTDLTIVVRFRLSAEGGGTARTPVNLVLAVLRSGTVLGEFRPEIVKATPGKSFRIEKTLTASSEKGSYALRVRLSGSGKTAERTVDFTIE